VQLNQQSTRLLQFATAQSSRVDYKKPQRAQNTAACVVVAANRPSDAKLHWLPVCQRVLYKMAALTRKTRTSTVSTYLNEHLVLQIAVRSTRSVSLPLLTVPKLTNAFSRQSFCYSAPITLDRHLSQEYY